MMMAVHVCYAPTSITLWQRTVLLPMSATVFDAVDTSGILCDFPAIYLHPVGIFGKRVTWQTHLRHGDRVEIYRPLQVDPMISRRQRAQEQALLKKRRSP